MTDRPAVDPRSTDAPDDRYAEDLALAKAILSGSSEAWHTFIGLYSRLIKAVIRRYVRRDDEVRSLYANVLEALYRGGLANYGGRSRLSTWLVPIARAAVVDDVRRRLGGRRLHGILQSLSTFERQVFRLYYVDGLGFGEVLRMTRERDAPVTLERLLEALESIEARVRGGHARRLRYDLYAQSVGAASGRLLEYLDHVRLESEADVHAPDYELMEREATRLMEQIRAEVERLPIEERRMLSLRFEHGWTARRISDELGLGGQRAVYTWLDRILRGIRRVLERGEVRVRSANRGVAADNASQASKLGTLFRREETP